MAINRFDVGCIYLIINIINNKFYIGSSNNFNRRKKEHLNQLECNTHFNKYLQSSYNKYGKSNFIFVKLFNNINKLEVEQVILNYADINNNKNCYNLSDLASCPNNNKKVYRISKDLNSFKKYKSIKQASKDNNIESSNISSCCLRKRTTAGGFYWSFDEPKNFKPKVNNYVGAKSKEHKKIASTNMLKAQKVASKNRSKKVTDLNTNKIYNSISEASKDLKVCSSTISNTVNKKVKNNLNIVYYEHFEI